MGETIDATIKRFFRGKEHKTRGYSSRVNTVIRIDDNMVGYDLWGTTIAKFNKKTQTLTLNTDGWRSVTTIKRLTSILNGFFGGYRGGVCSSNGSIAGRIAKKKGFDLLIWTPERHLYWNGKPVELAEGLVKSGRENVIPDKDIEGEAEYDKRLKQSDRMKVIYERAKELESEGILTDGKTALFKESYSYLFFVDKRGLWYKASESILPLYSYQDKGKLPSDLSLADDRMIAGAATYFSSLIYRNEYDKLKKVTSVIGKINPQVLSDIFEKYLMEENPERAVVSELASMLRKENIKISDALIERYIDNQLSSGGVESGSYT